MKIAVIGGGISGITASYLLSREHEVELFEAENRLGGHTNTVEVDSCTSNPLKIDTGFIVLNDCNYGVLHNLFCQWGIEVRWSDMSFSFYNPKQDYYYAGTDVFGLFPTWQLLTSREHLSLLWEIFSFGKIAQKELKNFEFSEDYLFSDFVDKHNLSSKLLNCYLLPIASAIWSIPVKKVLNFPAKNFLFILKNHGLLDLANRPHWQTVNGGSSAYIDAFKKKFSGKVHINSRVHMVQRNEKKVLIKLEDFSEFECDEVVFACHADQVLSLVEKPSRQEFDCFSKWKYQKNTAVLHSDVTIMPPKKRVWASWNYYADEGSSAVLTYYVNKLQGLNSSTPYFVTLNSDDNIDSNKVLKKILYSHPIFTKEAIITRPLLKEIQGEQRTYFCGSYFGDGFHEDGARSGAQVALLKGIVL